MRRRRRSRLGWLTVGYRPFGLVLVGLLVLLGAMALGPLQSFTAAADRVDGLAVTRDKLRSEVERLEEHRERLQDPDELEIIARQELGMIKPGEVPFVVVTPRAEVEQVGPEAPEEPEPDDAWYRRLGRTVADWFS